MYRRFSAAAAALSLSLFSGCAIHPLPEDVTGVDTYHIVRQIRCETREALRKMVIDWLRDLGTDHPSQPADLHARELADLYETDPDAFSDFGPQVLPGPKYVHERDIINLFADAGIAYNLDLTITENNDFTGDVNFLKPLFSGKFTLGVKADATRSRQNERVFTATDTFGYLVTQLNKPKRGVRYCDRFIVGPNYVYPIVGQIGVYKSVRSFVELTLFGALGAHHEGDVPGPVNPPAPPTMVDKLTFTTTVDISATPKVEFTPAGTQFQIVDASIGPSVKRMDEHKVFLGLAIASDQVQNVDPLRTFLFLPDRGSPVRRARVAGATRAVSKLAGARLMAGRRVTGGGTNSEILAVIAIDQLKSRELELVGPL